ncbi:MAG: TPM domain-containing protein [Verrucomicrobiia bacterium]
MQTNAFLNQLDDGRIVAAIAQAERKSSGEIRVYISKKQVEDALSEAKVHFLRLGMEKTQARNGVLIYIAPRSQNFAIVGDVGLDRHCGQPFWAEIATEMEARLKRNEYTDAVLWAVERVGALLAARFPRSPDDRNELPDDVARG